jgi:hypothetical protein
MLPSQSLMAHATPLLSNRRTAATHQRRLLDRRWRDGLPVLGSSQKGKTYFLWRTDMPTFYSSLLRQKVLAALVAISQYRKSLPILVRSRARIYNEGEKDEDSSLRFDKDAARRLDRSVALLWIGPNPLAHEETAPYTNGEDVYTRASTCLPIFDLPSLLGEEGMSSLRSQAPEVFALSPPPTPSSNQPSQSPQETRDRGDATPKTQKGNWLIIKTPRAKNGRNVASVKTEEVFECVSWLWRAEGYFGCGGGAGGGDGTGEVWDGEGEGERREEMEEGEEMEEEMEGDDKVR